MQVGTLEIQLMADMARLQTDLNQARRSVGDTVDKMNQILGTIGVGISVVGFANFIKQAINAGDAALELSQKIGVAVKDIAGLELAFRQSGLDADTLKTSISKLSRNVAEGSEALKAMGIATRNQDGALKSTRQLLGEVADKFASYEDNAAKTALAQSLFGKSGADLIPVLNQGAQSLDEFDALAKKLGLTFDTVAAKQADELNDTLDLMGQGLSGLGRRIGVGMLPTLNGLSQAFFGAATQGDNIRKVADFLSTALRGLIAVGIGVVGTFQTVGQALGGAMAMLVSIFKGGFSQAREIFKELKKDLSGNFKSTVDGMTAAWNASGAAAVGSIKETNEQAKIQAPILADLEDKNNKLRNAENARKKALEEASRVEHEYVKLLVIERKAREDLLKPYRDSAKSAEDRLDAMNREAAATDLAKRQQISLEQAIELTTIARLQEKKAIATDSGIIVEIEREIAARQKIVSVIKQNDQVNKNLTKSTQQATSEIDQMWVQAGRNIQSTLANSIFNFFDDGLKGMVKNVITAVGSIASEFAALRLSQAIGLGSMFGMSGTASAASSGMNALNLASMGSGAMSLVRGGFGVTGMVGEGLSGLGALTGSANLAAFGGGFAGDALGGLAAGGFTSGAAGAASLGASMAAVAGPLAAAAITTQVFRMFAGDKRMGGGFGKALNTVGDIPILGDLIPVVPLMNALFGHGPMKFRQQSLQGTVSGDGFDGDITNVFRAKGGLFVGNKHRPETEQLSAQMQDAFDTAIGGFYKSAHGFAENLGLSTSLVDNFTQELQIKSEKGKKLTEEQISAMISGIGDSIAKNLLPSIETLQKAGETQFQTLTRLNDQFNALTHGAENLGASIDYARQLVSNLSFEQRDSFIKMSGGIEALNSKTQFFADNFLTDAERMAPVSERLHLEMSKLGFSADITKDQFKALVQSLSITDETRNALLDLAPAFLAVKSAAEQVTQVVDRSGLMASLGSAFTDLQKSVDAQRKSATQKYNDAVKESDRRIQDVTASIGKLKTLSDSLKSSVEKLRPLTRDEAKLQLLSAINGAKRGIFPEQGSLDRALGVLTDNGSITNARSSFEFAREQAKTANMIADLGDLTDDQLTVEQRSLDQLERQRKILDQGFSDEMTRLDNLVESAQKQIGSLTGINTAVLDLSKAIGEFNRASQLAGGGSIGGGMVSGNPGISDQQIRDFVKTPGLTDMDIYSKAKSVGVSFEQYARARGIDVNALYKWADERGLPRFAAGGFHRGGLRVVGERGPEIERTGPSHITSNKDMKKTIGNDEVISKLDDLIKIFESVTQGGTALRTKQVA